MYTLIIWLTLQGNIIARASHAFGTEALCLGAARDMRAMALEKIPHDKRIIFCIGPKGPEA